MRISNAITERGHYDCQEHLSQGAVCFVGSRSEAIQLLNSGKFNWDEEWIQNAHFKGITDIAYTYTDGPNGIQTKLSFGACTRAFLTNPHVGPALDSN